MSIDLDCRPPLNRNAAPEPAAKPPRAFPHLRPPPRPRLQNPRRPRRAPSCRTAGPRHHELANPPPPIAVRPASASTRSADSARRLQPRHAGDPCRFRESSHPCTGIGWQVGRPICPPTSVAAQVRAGLAHDGEVGSGNSGHSWHNRALFQNFGPKRGLGV